MTAPVAQAPTKIAMPMTQSAREDAIIIACAMPSKGTLEALPEPVDSSVTRRAVPTRTPAFIGYSGTGSQSRYEEHLNKLHNALAQAGLRWHGEPVWARFDPLWTPWFMRRDEIWLELV